MDFMKTMMIAASGMQAQSTRMRVVAENIANANSTALEPGQDPYRRRIVSFENTLNDEIGAKVVSVGKISTDRSAFGQRYDPSHPAADDKGYIQLPNVNSLIEMMDMREAQRSYEANLSVIGTSRSMLMATVDLLK